MTVKLLEGVRVLDIAGEPLAMTGRLLADMGAEVVKLEPPGGDPLRTAAPLSADGRSLRHLAWDAGKSSVEYREDDRRIEALLVGCHIVLETPGFPGALSIERDRAPQAVWLKATPFGLDGPRSGWRASDIGIMAACGNMNCTGFPDRAPLRCSEPAGYAHCGAEAVFAVLSALATGRPQLVDLSMQEAVMIANMGGAGQYPRTGRKGTRQGADLGGTREIWPCRDGFVSFGLRGGPARARNFTILLAELEKEGLATPAWTDRDWAEFNCWKVSPEELRAIEEPLMAYFERHTMHDLYDLTVATNLMLAPANSAAEILGNEQLRARDMFLPAGDVADFPARFYRSSEPEAGEHPVQAPTPAPALDDGPAPTWQAPAAAASTATGEPAWAGLKILEFGSGAAGPIATRYFSEHGATVVRVESRKRPDFLRVMAMSSDEGIEGSTLFDVLNPGKKSITINLKHPEGKAVAEGLVQWADAVVENFAPKAMKGWGLDYAELARKKPDLVMLSTCLNGQSGPHKHYPGFGGQGAALAGYNYLTGWPDREPIGPFGTITDSLSPRFAAGALAAALLFRRRTGRGLHLDVSQVETGAFSLSPWLLEEAVHGESHTRMGNRTPRAAPHGAFPTAGEDRWLVIACWSDREWQALAERAGIEDRRFATLEGRLEAVDELEAALADWTRDRDAEELAEALQSLGIEAVPVVNFEDLLERDAQLAHRDHFVPLERAVTGLSVYERNGFRLEHSPSVIDRPTPLIGEHNDEILADCLGMDEASIAALKESGAIE